MSITRVVFALAMVLCLALAQGRAQAISALWANEGGDKVTREELRVGVPNGRKVLSRLWDGTTVRIRGAKNEVVNFTIILEAATQQATDVAVSFTTLTGPGGALIQSRSTSGDGVFNWVGRPIELFYVRYLQIKGLSLLGYENYYDERHVPERLRRPWTGDGVASGTWQDRPDHDRFYPDIAVPLELVPSFTIAAQTNQSIWVDVYIPRTAVPGTYTGTVTITEHGGFTHSLPVELTVYGFALPDEPTAKTMLDFSGEDINDRYLGTSWIMPPDEELAATIQDRHALLAHRHKISLIGDDSYINSDYTEEDHPAPLFAARLNGSFFTDANGYDGPGVNVGNNVYSVCTYGIPESWKSDTAMRRHSDAWVNWFESHAPTTEYFLYLIDESDVYWQTEQWAGWLATNPGPGKRLKSFATIDLPSAVDSTPSLVIPASAAGIGIPEEWESAASTYSHDPVKRFFLYNGSRPAVGCFMTEDDGVALRVNAWTQFKKHINRWFYWQSTYYNDFQGGSGKQDLFQMAHTFGSFSSTNAVRGQTGWNYSNGDGVLFYPGTDKRFPASSYNVNGPFASLRMKYWRRGLQDHDYLTMASAIDPAATAAIVNAIIPKVAWEVGVDEISDPTYVHTNISWSTDPDVWEAARDSLAGIIAGVTGIAAGNASMPAEMKLEQNWPNPCNPSTTIAYNIAGGRQNAEGSKQKAVQVKLVVYDLLGREVAVLVEGYQMPGEYRVVFTGKDLASGVYLYRLTAGGRALTRRLVLLK